MLFQHMSHLLIRLGFLRHIELQMN